MSEKQATRLQGTDTDERTIESWISLFGVTAARRVGIARRELDRLSRWSAPAMRHFGHPEVYRLRATRSLGRLRNVG